MMMRLGDSEEIISRRPGRRREMISVETLGVIWRELRGEEKWAERAFAEAKSSHSSRRPFQRYFLCPGSKEAERGERRPFSEIPPPIPVEKVR